MFWCAVGSFLLLKVVQFVLDCFTMFYMVEGRVELFSNVLG